MSGRQGVDREDWKSLGISILNYSHGSFKSWLEEHQPKERKITPQEIRDIAKKIRARMINYRMDSGWGEDAGRVYRMLAIGPRSNMDAISIGNLRTFFTYKVDRKNWRLKIIPCLADGFRIGSSRKIDFLDNKIFNAINVQKQILDLPEPIVYLACPSWVSQQDDYSFAVGSYVFKSEAKELARTYLQSLKDTFEFRGGEARPKLIYLGVPPWINSYIIISSRDFISQNLSWGVAKEIAELYTDKIIKELNNPKLYCVC